MNFSNQNSKNSIPCVIPTVREVKEKFDNDKSKNTSIFFFKISLIIKCYKCQDYRYVAANCPSLFKITVNDRVPIETPTCDIIIFSEVTSMIKEFNISHPFSSLAWLPTPPSSPSLLSILTVVIHFDHQPLSLLLQTLSLFLLWPMLVTKSKFSTDVIPIVN